MSSSSENLRHACASAAELSRHVWEALTPAQRSEMTWRYGHQIANRPFTSEIAQARSELQAVGLVGSHCGTPWGAFVFAVNGGKDDGPQGDPSATSAETARDGALS